MSEMCTGISTHLWVYLWYLCPFIWNKFTAWITKFAICSIVLLSLGETCRLKVRDMVTVWRTLLLLSCYDWDSTHQHYDVTRFKCVLWRRTMHEWVMNNHYQMWIAQGRCINMIRTPSKQWGVFDNVYILISNDDIIKWEHFPRYWPLWGEFTGPQWIPLTKASDAELWYFLWYVPVDTVK